MPTNSRLKTILVLLTMLLLAGCFFRNREAPVRASTAVLKEASLQQLIDVVNSNAAQFKSMNARVDIDSSVGGSKKGKITDNPGITGILLVRKPDMLRLIGQVPVVKSRAFDMVSTATGFQLAIPSRGKFIIGSNEIHKISDKPLENLRPQHIFDALLLKEIDPQKDIVVTENGVEIVKDPKTHKDVEQADYVLLVLSKDDQGYYLSRKIVFNREDLLPERQLIYNRQSQLVTDARYNNPKDFNGIKFPTRIDIERPVEEYTITLNISTMTLNDTLDDEKFKLTQPPGSQLVNLDDKPTAQNDTPGKKPPR